MVTYRGLEFDPTPGRLDDVAATAARLTTAAEALAAVGAALRAAERHSLGWRGEAAESFRARLSWPEVDPRVRSLRAAAAVLERWAGTLAANQRRTEELDAVAVRLRARLRAAQDDVQDRQNALDLAATPATAAAAGVELAAARRRASDLAASLAEVLDRAGALAGDHRRAADAVAAELDSGAGPPPASAVPPAVLATAGVLDLASATSATLAAVLAPPGRRAVSVPTGAGAAFAAALADGVGANAGELVVPGTTPLGGRR